MPMYARPLWELYSTRSAIPSPLKSPVRRVSNPDVKRLGTYEYLPSPWVSAVYSCPDTGSYSTASERPLPTKSRRRVGGIKALVIVVESVEFALSDPPPDTDTAFTCGVVALAATFTVTVIG